MRAAYRALVAATLALLITGSSAFARDVFTVARRNSAELVSIEFICEDVPKGLDCSLSRARIARKLTEDKVSDFSNWSASDLAAKFNLFTNGGQLCGGVVKDAEIEQRVLGPWGEHAPRVDVVAFVSAWRQMCTDRSLDAIRAVLRARSKIDLSACEVFNWGERILFTAQSGRYVHVDANAGVLCPGSVIIDSLTKDPTRGWVYTHQESINSAPSSLCAKAGTQAAETFIYADWAAPAPFSCHTIEFGAGP